jgi:plasmid stabilization system protein ParE
MVNQVVWTPKAVNQVEDILEFLTKEVSENAATKFLETVLSKVKSLEYNTYEGRPVPNMRTVRFVLVETPSFIL